MPGHFTGGVYRALTRRAIHIMSCSVATSRRSGAWARTVATRRGLPTAATRNAVAVTASLRQKRNMELSESSGSPKMVAAARVRPRRASAERKPGALTRRERVAIGVAATFSAMQLRKNALARTAVFF